MISWLQTNLEKHFRSVFVVLLVVIVVSFVFVIGEMPALGGHSTDKTANLNFFDTDLNTEAKRAEFSERGTISAQMQFGGMRLNPDQISTFLFNRATALHLANLHNVPAPTKEQVQEHIKTLPLFAASNGDFDPVKYSNFVDSLTVTGRISQAALFSIISDDYRIDQVNRALAGPGFVLPEEALSDLRQDQTKWTIAVATWNMGEYNPDVDATDEKLKAFYETNSFRYATPARRQIDYVELKAADLGAGVVPTEKQLQEYFQANRSKYQPPAPAPAEGEEAAAPEPVALADVIARVTADYKLQQGRAAAHSKAEALVLKIMDTETGGAKNANKDAITKAALESVGLKTKTTTPFSSNETPIGVNWSRAVVAQAFALNPGLFYSEPITEGDTTLVLFYNKEIPETVPELDEVRGAVVADYVEEESRRLRDEQGKAHRETLAAADSLDAFKAATETLKMSVVDYRDFTRRETPAGLDRSLVYSFSNLAQGDVSEMIARDGKGTYVYIASKTVPEIDSDNPEFQARLESLKSNYERFAAAQFIAKLASEEMVRSGISR